MHRSLKYKKKITVVQSTVQQRKSSLFFSVTTEAVWLAGLCIVNSLELVASTRDGSALEYHQLGSASLFVTSFYVKMIRWLLMACAFIQNVSEGSAVDGMYMYNFLYMLWSRYFSTSGG